MSPAFFLTFSETTVVGWFKVGFRTQTVVKPPAKDSITYCVQSRAVLLGYAPSRKGETANKEKYLWLLTATKLNMQTKTFLTIVEWKEHALRSVVLQEAYQLLTKAINLYMFVL